MLTQIYIVERFQRYSPSPLTPSPHAETPGDCCMVQTKDWIDERSDDGQTEMTVRSCILAATDVTSPSPSVHHHHRHDVTTTCCCCLATYNAHITALSRPSG